MSSNYLDPSVNAIISGASNVSTGTNSAFTRDDFLAFYPQFTDQVTDSILDQFIAMADATVKEVRWHGQWNFAMCLFVAHFLTLYLQTLTTSCSPSASQVVAAAQARGLQVSKSVGDVSVSYDFSQSMGDVAGWGGFKSTAYGVQYLQMAKLLGKAGMMVW